MKRCDWATPQFVRRIEDRRKYTWLEVVLAEGKNREVRRMIEAVGFKVLKLVRTRIGPLTLDGLEVGKGRPLGPAEVAALKRSGGKQGLWVFPSATSEHSRTFRGRMNNAQK